MIGVLRGFCKQNYFRSVNKNLSADTNLTKCYFSQKPLDINTSVTKDVILYKYKNDRFFKIINIFGLCQFGFWAYLSVFAYTSLKDVPVNSTKEMKWWQKINFGEDKYRYTFSILSFLIGWGMLTVAWTYSLKSVKFLILRKGGQKVTIVTYTPTGHNRMFTLDLHNLNCKDSRITTRSQLPIKVKGHYLHYILDMNGEFTNPILFDSTAGLQRRWNS